MVDMNFVSRTLWTGDNLDILRGMNSETVDLMYLDPPFNSNRTYSAPVGSRAAGAAFKDTWTLSDLDVAWMGLIADEEPAIANLLNTSSLTHGKGMQSYLTMMAVRLLEMRRVLKPTGSIYLHCDPTASHYLKILMDAIWGQGNFRNELVWHFPDNFQGNVKRFANNHNIIFFYAAAPFTFNHVRIPLDKPRKRGGRIWSKELGKVVPERGPDGKPVYRTYYDKKADDVWTIGQSSVTNPQSKERVGYPTQKPLALLERIIEASSNEGDMVLDPFCGCATACVAAENLGRQWVGIDLSEKAVELVNIRLADTMGSLFHNRLVTARTDIPRRTDIDSPKNYRKNKHVLYGQQEGRCGGCRTGFEFRHMEVDHIIPQARGGTDHVENLQLLCGHCNRIKGVRPQEYLAARLHEMGVAI